MHRTRAYTASASLSFRRACRAASVLAPALVVAGLAAAVALPAAAADKPAQAKPAAAKPAKATSAAKSPGAKMCYSHSEHAAEQLVRLHTEMMIAGLTCKDVMPDKAPFAKYQEFTVKHRPTISKAEGELMSHFRRTGKGNATNKFDMYRTEVANEVSRRASIIGTENYCQTFVPRAEHALSLNAEEVRTLTADEKNAGLMHLSQQPLCDVQVVSGPDPVPGTVLASAEPPRSKAKSKATTPAKTTKPAAPAKPKTAAATPAAQTAQR